MHHKHGIRQNVTAVCCRGRGSESLEGYSLKTTPRSSSHNVKILKILGNEENRIPCASGTVRVSQSYT